MSEPSGPEGPDDDGRSGPSSSRSLLIALLRQAWILSVVYLIFGAVVALARRYSDAAFWVDSSRMLDAVAQAILVELKLWPAFIRAVAFGRISPTLGRMVLGTITVLMIHAQALFLGVLFIAINALGLRRTRHDSP